MYIERPDGSLRFRWARAPTSAELAGLTQTLARRIGRYLERQGLLERDAENSYLVGDVLEAGPMDQLLGSSITYRIAVGPQQGRKVFTLQTLPGCEEACDAGGGKVAGFSLHAGVAARADQRQKLERLCRYISRPAISEKRLSLTTIGDRLYPKFTCNVLIDVELTAPRRMPTPRITRIEKPPIEAASSSLLGETSPRDALRAWVG